MPQPIDMQTEVARLIAAERIQQVADRISLAAQQRAAHHVAERQVSDETRVQQTPEGDAAQVHPDARRRQRDNERRHARPENEESDKNSRTFYNADEREEIADDPGGHRLDVSI